MRPQPDVMVGHWGHRTGVCVPPCAAPRVTERTREAAGPRVLFLKPRPPIHTPARKGKRAWNSFPCTPSRKQGFLLHGRGRLSVAPSHPLGRRVAFAGCCSWKG